MVSEWMEKGQAMIYSLPSYSGTLFAQEKGILAVRPSDNGPENTL
jgi:hypothetical protein